MNPLAPVPCRSCGDRRPIGSNAPVFTVAGLQGTTIDGPSMAGNRAAEKIRSTLAVDGQPAPHRSASATEHPECFHQG
jgi:hypothetical protein